MLKRNGIKKLYEIDQHNKEKTQQAIYDSSIVFGATGSKTSLNSKSI